MIDLIEGIEYLLLEGLYFVNSGNIRRAWTGMRRIVGFAEFMGLNKGARKGLEVLDTKTMASCPANWFQIVYGESGLSLLLGIPSSVLDNSFASENNMIRATSLDRLERVHAVICGKIIQRNETQVYHEFTPTSKIDYDLQKAAIIMDSNWWLLPNFDLGMNTLVLMETVMRAHTQIVHYYLRLTLDLPVMLRDSSEKMYDYNKTTCFYASREILSRWIHLRGFVSVVFCCRWPGFCAFTASLTLLLAHIDSRTNFSAEEFRHLRVSDMLLVETAMETMDEFNKVNGDLLTKKIAEVVRRRLIFEADALNSNRTYSARSSSQENTDGELQSHIFRPEIPYFGTVSITNHRARSAQSQSVPGNLSLSHTSNIKSDWSSSELESSFVGSYMEVQN